MESVRSRIMYVESKAGGLRGPARIGRVSFSKTGRTLHYGGRSFQSLRGAGFKANYYDIETGEQYWISGPKKDGSDRLYGGLCISQPQPRGPQSTWPASVSQRRRAVRRHFAGLGTIVASAGAGVTPAPAPAHEIWRP